ncbi:MAG: PP2C family protein-serine/threonine phosphatase [Acidobacteriota bacterium]
MEAAKSKIERTPLTAELDRCRERMENLKECFRVSGLINSTLELEEVLENIMTSSRTILRADACSLMLVDDQTGELVFEVAQGPVAHLIKGGFRLKKGEGIAGHVFETGTPLLIEDAYQHPRFNRAFDLKTGYRTRSILCVPLMAKDRVIGVSQFINRLDGAPFDAEDLETITLLNAHAAVAIENARLHRAVLRKQQIERDLSFATNIQLSFLPQEVPRIEGFGFRTHYRPALEIGGDFYDFIPLDGGRLGILIGDVSGKGIASALYMAKLTSDFRLLAIRHSDPARLVERLNDLLSERSRRGMFVTLLYIVLDPAERRITYVNAGHLPPLLWNGGALRPCLLRDEGGPPVGIVSGHGYSCGTADLEPGDCLLLATDGVIEAKNGQGELFGWKRLEDAVMRGGSNVDTVYGRVVDAIGAFVGDCPASDDTTMVLFDFEG